MTAYKENNMNPINWVKDRLEERTSWDGAVLIGGVSLHGA